jgi:hypothetical protein
MRALAMICLAASAAAAQNTLTPEETKQGWRLLFDGKTMKGWQDPARKNRPGDAWAVENGCLKTRLKPRIEEDLISEESFGDFELKFAWRVSPGGNTGVKYRIQDTVFVDVSKHPTQAGEKFEQWLGREIAQRISDRARMAPGSRAFVYTVGFEFQLLDDERHPDAKRDPRHVSGALYSMIAPAKRTARPAGQWNDALLVVRGNRVQHWINGEKVLEGTLDADAVRVGVMKRWAPAPSIRDSLLNPRLRGPISLQHHSDEVWFRDVKIRGPK